MSAPSSDRAVDAFLAVLGERGWAATTLGDVATRAELGFAELYATFPGKIALLSAAMAWIDRQVLAGVAPSLDPEETPRDRLFDTLMRRYDALAAHREAVRSACAAVRRDPLLALQLVPAVRRSQAAMLAASGIDTDGARGAVRIAGLAAIHARTLRAFLADGSADLSATMAMLDSQLRAAESRIQTIEKYIKS